MCRHTQHFLCPVLKSAVAKQLWGGFFPGHTEAHSAQGAWHLSTQAVALQGQAALTLLFLPFRQFITLHRREDGFGHS